MRRLAQRFAVVLAVLFTWAGLAGATLSRPQAEAFERKVAQITQGTRAGEVRRTTVTEDELNSWFTYRAEPLLPDGIIRPQVSLLGGGRLTGQATLDFAAIGRQRSTGGWLDPWALLGGRLPIAVTGTLQARNGAGRFMLESATLGGIPIPSAVLQELVSLYTRSDERPRGIGIDEAIPLPAGVRAVEIGRGAAVVVQ